MPERFAFEDAVDSCAALLRADPETDPEWRALLSKDKQIDRLTDLGLYAVTQKDITELCEPIRDQLETVAVSTVQRLYSSKIRQAKHKNFFSLKPKHRDEILAITDSILNAHPYFSYWPEKDNRELLKLSTVISLREGDSLFAEGERTFFAILLSGQIRVERKENPFYKDGPCFVFSPEMALGTQPCPHTVKASSQVVALEVEVGKVRTALKSLVKHAPGSHAYFPDISHLTAKERKLRSTALFADFSAQELAQISSHMTEHNYPEGATLCKMGEISKNLMLFCAGAFIIDEAATTKHHPVGTVLESAINHTIAETEFFFREKMQYTLRAIRPCTVWTISRDVCFFIMDVDQLELFKKNCYQQRAVNALKERNKKGGPYEKNWIDRFQLSPIVGSVCSVEIFREMRLRVYEPNQTIASAVSICDKVILITGGENGAFLRKAGKHIMVPDFTVVGVTCVAQHRWLHPLVSNSFCDVWEMPRSAFVAKLREHHVLPQVLSYVDSILTGRLAPREDEVVLFPTSNMENAHTKLVSLRAPIFHKCWFEAIKPPKPTPEPIQKKRIEQPQEEAIPVTSDMLLQKLVGIRSAESVAPAKAEVEVEERLVKQVPLAINRNAAVLAPKMSGVFDDVGRLVVIDEEEEEEERPPVFSEVELSRISLQKFLEADIPFRRLPSSMLGPASPIASPIKMRRPRWKRVTAGIALCKQRSALLPCKPVETEIEAFTKVVKEKQKEEACRPIRVHAKRPDKLGVYRHGVFRWHFMTPEKFRPKVVVGEDAASSIGTPSTAVRRSPLRGRTQKRSFAAWFSEGAEGGGGAVPPSPRGAISAMRAAALMRSPKHRQSGCTGTPLLNVEYVG